MTNPLNIVFSCLIPPSWPDWRLLRDYLAGSRDDRAIGLLHDVYGEACVRAALDSLRPSRDVERLSLFHGAEWRSRLLQPFGAVPAGQQAIAAGRESPQRDLLREDPQQVTEDGCRRWIVERDNAVVAVGEFRSLSFLNRPGAFEIRLEVQPVCQEQRIVALLYDQLIEALELLHPQSVRATIREDQERVLSFLKENGFRESQRTWDSTLDVSSIDSSPFRKAEDRVRTQGIRITSVAELQDDPALNRKLFELMNEIILDVPLSEGPARLSYDFFVQKILGHPGFLAEAFFVAIQDDRYVGLTNLFVDPRPDTLVTRQTGVRRVNRRQGLGLAMKLRAIRYAKKSGYKFIRTQNASNNEPIMRLNESLGFAKEIGWVNLVKV